MHMVNYLMVYIVPGASYMSWCMVHVLFLAHLSFLLLLFKLVNTVCP